jgi:Zn-dependent protease
MSEQVLLQNPFFSILFMVLAFMVSFSVHEFSHAFLSYKFGDPTAKNKGRLTLNPISHLDPVGTILPILLILSGSPVVIGWGKPVPIDPSYYKNKKRDVALVSLAGPLSNIVLSVISSLFITTGIVSINSIFGNFLYILTIYSLVLGFFNLIPLGPLDGNKIVYGFLPNNLAVQWIEIQRYGTMILLFLIIFNLTDRILLPLVGISMNILGL